MPEPDLLPAERREIWMEIGVVISLGILIYFLSVVVGWMHARPPQGERTAASFLYSIGACLQIIIPLLWIMHRSGRSWSYYGIRPLDLRLDIPLSLLIAGAIYAAHYGARWSLYLSWYVVPWLHTIVSAIDANHEAVSRHRTHPTNALDWTALALYMLANGAAEELVLRAYLLPRFREVLGRPFLAVLIVSALSASYHLYQGSFAGAVIFCSQVFIGLLYFKIRRILPFAIGHALYDTSLSIFWA